MAEGGDGVADLPTKNEKQNELPALEPDKIDKGGYIDNQNHK